ncbi:MAG: Lon protease family protein, partial [Stellaceae bacterium]
MSLERLAADAVGPPAFEVPPAATSGEAPHIFDLCSHRRAREALEFGLGVPELGFNIFVVGEDRSGRMTATLELLAEHAKHLPRPSDWIYLPNFRHPERPRPHRLPAGIGRLFRDRLQALLPSLSQALARAFEAAEFATHLERESAALQQAMGAAFAELNAFAAEHGYAIERTPQGMALRPQPGNEPEALEKLSDAERQKRLQGLAEVRQRLGGFLQAARQADLKFADTVREARRQTADAALMPLVDGLGAEFGNYPGLARWIVELRNDLVDHLDLLAGPADPEAEAARRHAAEERYAVNLFVDHGEEPSAPVVLEPTPSYENLFGRFEFRFLSGVAVTDYRHIRPGALHRANDGILVLRAEALAAQPMVWSFLKASLRDRCIRIEPPQTGGPPIAGATSPHAIPLNVKVVIVGAPRWYYTGFSTDPDFSVYFKIKAEIDPDLPAEPQDLALYARLIRFMALRHLPGGITDRAAARLLAEAARWAQHRRKLSARFEQVEDLIAEAAAMARADRASKIDAPQVLKMLTERRLRRARIEDRTQEAIREGLVLIDTDGARVGQVNGLTVRDLGDHAFGAPVRISARVQAGRLGIVNVERATELGGPIQQKGVYIIGGYLSGCFARRLPLSFSATVTFEQSYGGVEGDSASMGELVAVISALADVPLRQDIAITGSVNQAGESQPIGGAIEKIEGFFRTCAERGLTGRQGVVIPAANASHVILSEEVTAAVAAGKFQLWTMHDVHDALELLTGQDPGRAGTDGAFPAGSVM